MSTFKLLLAEIRFRKLNFLSALLAVVAAATLFVAGPVLIDGYARETDAYGAQSEDEARKVGLKLGFNLMIMHKDANMADFWAEDFVSKDLPQHYVDELAKSPLLKHVRHLQATLQQKIEWRKRKVLLVGYLRETPQTHFKFKKPLGFLVKPGEAFLGYELWNSAEIKVGDKIEILGREFTVAKTRPETGSKKDIEIAVNLSDAQLILGKPDRVSQILAIGCKCDSERLPTIRKELAAVLPDTKITEFVTKAQARAEQRELVARNRKNIQSTMENLAAVITPLVVLVCGAWIGLLAFSNVRERRTEIGLLRALGKSSPFIAGLFLGRALLLGLFGGGLGFLLGSFVARQVGVHAAKLNVNAAYFSPAYDMLLWSLLGAPLICVVASYLPTIRAIFQDPAVVLRDS